MTGKATLWAIHFPIWTHSVMLAVPTSASPVMPPTTAEVPTKPASQPARSMMRASAAVGGCSTERTRSLRASSSRRRTDFGLLLEATAGVQPHGVVPEELSLARLGHVPSEHHPDGLREMAFPVRIVRGVHQHVLADEVDHRVGELVPFWDLDALEVAAAGHVVARLRLERGD